MKSLKKIIVWAGLLVFSNILLFANDSFNITFNSNYGLLNGHIYEYVFLDRCTNTDNLESKLDWEILNVPYVELAANATLFKYITLNFNSQICIPQSSGYMQDYDWMNFAYEAWQNDDPTEITNYSKSPNEVKEFYTINVLLGGNLYLNDNLTFTPFLGYNYQYLYFLATGGYKIYKSNGFIEQQISDGPVIAYKQEYNSFVIGFNANYRPVENLLLNFSYEISPKLSINNALDFHYRRSKVFWDNIKYTLWMDSKVSAAYRFNRRHSIGTTLSCHYSPLATGKNYENSLDEKGNIKKDETTGAYTKFFQTTSKGGSSALYFGASLDFTLSF